MRALPLSVTVRSRGLWPAVLAFGLASVAAGMVGCVWSDGGSSSGGNGGPPIVVPPTLDIPKQVTITPGETLQTKPGAGVGIFVEYAAGGHWHVWTACDTLHSGAACEFKLFAIPEQGAEIFNLQSENLRDGDVAELLTDGSAHLSAITSTEFDGMTFDVKPGAVVELEAYVDGLPDPHFVYWFGDNTLHTGAPTDPVDFVPETP